MVSELYAAEKNQRGGGSEVRDKVKLLNFSENIHLHLTNCYLM